jgi:NAD(P)-dependent dehydrogenase (short-subunit alcohol dehydrogenase family)
MSQLLTNQTAIVTGGASGIGRMIALTFADHGADVVVADIRETPREGGEPTHERITTETDQTAVFVECDVTEREDLEAAVDAAEEFGGLDIMVNNAGIHSETPFFEITEEEFDQLMDINPYSAPFRTNLGNYESQEGGGSMIYN